MQTPAQVICLQITACMQLMSVCVFTCKQILYEILSCLNLHKKVLKLDKAWNRVLKRGKSGWRSSHQSCFAYHQRFVVLINHCSFGEHDLSEELWGKNDTKSFKNSRALRPGVLLKCCGLCTASVRVTSNDTHTHSCSHRCSHFHLATWRFLTPSKLETHLVIFECDTHLSRRIVWLKTVEWFSETLPATWLLYQTL